MSDQTEKDILKELREMKQVMNSLFLIMQKVNDNLGCILNRLPPPPQTPPPPRRP